MVEIFFAFAALAARPKKINIYFFVQESNKVELSCGRKPVSPLAPHVAYRYLLRDTPRYGKFDVIHLSGTA